MIKILLGLFIIVLWGYRTFLREGLTEPIKYEDIRDKTKIIGGNVQTDCIQTTISPHMDTVYNVGFKSPFDRYSDVDTDSTYNQSYYSDTSFNVDINIENSETNFFPYFKTYRYCDYINNEPSCVYTTCGISEKEHNFTIADLLKNKSTPVKQTAEIRLMNEKKNNESAYNNATVNSNNYTRGLTSFAGYIRAQRGRFRR